jgi:hypothetical protein
MPRVTGSLVDFHGLAGWILVPRENIASGYVDGHYHKSTGSCAAWRSTSSVFHLGQRCGWSKWA